VYTVYVYIGDVSYIQVVTGDCKW